ncbi:DUF2279 domain-containing protein [candidate division KSB1 bacterium]|nr:DUF2279 domain-containing protein [candidate division KSB1 bacterium]
MQIKIALLILLTTSIATAQLKQKTKFNDCCKTDCTTDTIKSDVKLNRLIIAGGGIVAANLAVYQPFKEVWWNEARTGFHFYRGYRRTEGYWDFGWNDSYFGHLDKLGHVYSSKILSEFLVELANWVGYKKSTSKIIGTTLSFIMMSEIEIYDSFFEEWGFSLADFSANALGAYSPYLSEKYPLLKQFKLKMSYHASEQFNSEDSFIKDYQGMTFWLAYQIKHVLPKNVQENLPDYLNIAIGYGVDKPHGNVEIYLAPDINLTRLIKTENPVFRKLIHFLDYIHVPMFTWKLTPQSKFYYLYF